MNEAALDWDKGAGLLPAIVQHADSGAVLMLGYMNRESLARSRETGRVTFYSRSRARLWTKGESSGHHLELESICADCDGDALLVRARPAGPVCHRGSAECFDAGPVPAAALAFLARLESVVAARKAQPADGSYTSGLFAHGVSRIAQKVGEEGVELALAAVSRDDEAVLEETADLLYHAIVLLHARGLALRDVAATLERRRSAQDRMTGGRLP